MALVPPGKFHHLEAAVAATAGAGLTVSPPSPAPGSVVTAAYTAPGSTPGAGWSLGFNGSVTFNGTTYQGVTGSLTVPGAPAAVTYQVPVCPGLVFKATADPAVFTATVPAGGTAAGPATVTGVVTAGGAAYPVTASIVLPAAAPATGTCQLGIYDPADDYPSSWAGVQAFQAAGCPVEVATYYVQWQGGFPVNLAGLALQHNVILLVELEPWYSTTTWPAFTDIAAGKYDAWLQQMAQAVKAYGHPVWMTYAHEQNGSWYPWGNGGAQKVTPAQWVASWQHVVTTMNAAAPGLITWVWAPNNVDVGSAEPYYPGDALVGQVAWDGYLQNSSQTYANFLAQTPAQIRKFTSKPIWCAETGVAPGDGTRAARIGQLFSAMKADGVTGFNWFNQGTFALSAAEVPAFASAVNTWNAS